MENDYVLLTEKEAMWAEMLMQALKDNDIPCTGIPVHGAGMVIRTGIQECFKIYVPCSDLPKARDLVHELFSGSNGESIACCGQDHHK